MIELIYMPFQLFQAVPVAAFLPAALFFAATVGLGGTAHDVRARSAARAFALAAAISWSLYSIWELIIFATGPTANIRVDLLLIAPLLLGVTLIACLFLVIAAASRGRSGG